MSRWLNVPLPAVQFATHNILHTQATQLYTLRSLRRSIHQFSKDFNNYKQLAIKAFHFLSRCSLWLVKPYANMDILYTTIIDRISQPHVHKTIPRLVDYGMCTYLKWFQHRHGLQEGLVYLPLKKSINTNILNIKIPLIFLLEKHMTSKSRILKIGGQSRGAGFGLRGEFTSCKHLTFHLQAQ